MAAALVFELKS